MKTKYCTKCKKDKLLSKFSKNKHAKDRLQCWCKKCLQEEYQENKEKRAKQEKEYHQKYPWKVTFQQIK